MSTIGRPRVARAYIWLTALVTLFVFIQGGLIGAWLYKPAESWILDTHGTVGSVVGFVAIMPFLLALSARFPRELKLVLVDVRLGLVMEHSVPRTGLRHRG